MHLKDISFAIANFLILFGALFFITRKMISRMFRERKEKIAGELDKAKKAEESAAALENQLNRDNELARQQEKQLLEDTQRQVEKNRVCAAGDSQEAANVLRQSAVERERQLRAIMHEEVSTQVVRQVAEETGKTLRKDEYAARRTALADAFIEKTGKMVTARPSDILTLAAGKKLAVTATGAEPLTEAQTEKLRRTLTDVFAAACRAAGEDAPCGEIIDLYSETDESVIAGMRLRVGDTVYDGSAARCLERLVHRAEQSGDESGRSVLDGVRSLLSSAGGAVDIYQVGQVISVSDGICRVSGLADVMAGEMLEFKGNLRGMVMDLDQDNVGVVLLGDFSTIQEGDAVRRSGHIIEVPVGEAVCGRVVNALGGPLDG